VGETTHSFRDQIVSTLSNSSKRTFFRRRFAYIISHDESVRKKLQDLEKTESSQPPSKFKTLKLNVGKLIKRMTVFPDSIDKTLEDPEEGDEPSTKVRDKGKGRWKPIIRRIDGFRVNELNVMGEASATSIPTPLLGDEEVGTAKRLTDSPELLTPLRENLDSQKEVETVRKQNVVREAMRAFSSSSGSGRRKRRSSDPGVERVVKREDEEQVQPVTSQSGVTPRLWFYLKKFYRINLL
jgi:hypothetical protein